MAEMKDNSLACLISIFDNIGERVYVADPETYELLYVNQPIKKAYGDVTGKKCYQAFHNLDAPCPACTNQHIFGENLGKLYVWQYEDKANQRWYRRLNKAIQWPNGRMVHYDLAIDITERKWAEVELRRRFEFERLIANLSTKFISFTPEEVDSGINQALKAIGEFYQVDRSYIFMSLDGGKTITNIYEWCAAGIDIDDRQLKGVPTDAFKWFARKINRREVIYIRSVDEMPAEAVAEKELFKAQKNKSVLCVPMVYGKSVIGFVGFDSVRSEKIWPQEAIDLLRIAAEMFANLLERKFSEQEQKRLNKELVKTNRRLKQLVLKDPNTGLYNHRYFEDVVEREFHRAKRYNHPLSMIMMDIDYFKSINEVYGHPFGDLVLQQLARQLKKMAHRYDIVIRYSGQEFVVLCLGSNRSAASILAQRMLEAVNLYNFGDKKHTVKLKITMAVASYPEDKVAQSTDLLKLSGQILNKAKEAGGNRVYSALDINKEKDAISKITERRAEIKFLKEKIDKLNKQANQSLIEAIFAFAKTIELKDHYTGEHVEKTVHYATEVARTLGMLSAEEIEMVRQAAILHDLGKIGISDKILCKRAKLSKKEFAEIRKHPEIGAEIIRPIQFLQGIIPYILYHHERWDGKGYPYGLKGEEIPLGARIVAIADVYQALISDRPYRKAYPEKQAIKIIVDSSGSHFDPRIVDVFLKVLQKK